jgi:mRNA interferase MazF
MTKTGDIIAVNLDPTVGGEKGKTRPCLVLVGSGHPWGIIIVVPITEDSANRSKKLFVPINKGKTTGLSKSSCVDCFQIRCLAEDRVVNKIGIAPAETLNNVLTKIACILNIGEEHITAK